MQLCREYVNLAPEQPAVNALGLNRPPAASHLFRKILMSSDQRTDRDNQQLIESLQQSDFSRRKFLLQTAAGAATAMLPSIMILPSSARAADAPTKSTTNADASKLDASKPASAKPAEFSLRAVSEQAAPDGRSRAVFTYDGKIPGPVIRAKGPDAQNQSYQRPEDTHVDSLARHASARHLANGRRRRRFARLPFRRARISPTNSQPRRPAPIGIIRTPACSTAMVCLAH